MKSIYKQTIYRAVKEPAFATGVFNRLPISEFDDDAKFLVTIVNSHYHSSREPLAEASFISRMEERADNKGKSEEDINKFQNMIEEIYELDYTDVNEDTVDEQIQSFIRTSLSREAIMDAVSKGSLGDEENIENLTNKLKEVLVLDVNLDNGGVIDFFKDVNLRKSQLKALAEDRYPTGFYNLDSIADGGLAKGEVGLVLASSGSGKTSWATNLARNYVMSGLNVLYVPLEEKTDRMIMRFDQLLSQQAKNAIMPGGDLDEGFYDSIQKAYDQMTDENRENSWGTLWIKKYRPHELTPNMFSQLISDLMVRTHKNIDVVVLDYPDLMRNPFSSGEKSEADAGGRLYEELRATAQEYNFVLWTLSQLNRTGYGQDVKKADAIEGSKRKLNAVELAFTINQEPEEFENGYIRVWVDKLRNNSGVSFDKMLYFKVDVPTMTIRDETQEEHMEHLELLGTSERVRGNDREIATKDVTGSVTSLNEMLGRV